MSDGKTRKKAKVEIPTEARRALADFLAAELEMLPRLKRLADSRTSPPRIAETRKAISALRQRQSEAAAIICKAMKSAEMWNALLPPLPDSRTSRHRFAFKIAITDHFAKKPLPKRLLVRRPASLVYKEHKESCELILSSKYLSNLVREFYPSVKLEVK